MPPGAAVEWSANNENIALFSGQGNSTAVFSKVANGKSNIKANVIFYSTTIQLTDFPVFVGVPSHPWISNGSVTNTYSIVNYNLCIGQNTSSLQLHFVTPGTSAEVSDWEITKTLYPSNFNLVKTGNTVIVTPNYTGVGQFKVKAYNSCGNSVETTINLTITTCSGGGPIDPPGWPIDFFITPNPASGNVTVSLVGSNNSENVVMRMNLTETSYYTIQLWNSFGLIKTIQTDQKSYQLDLTGVPPGFYYVHVIKDGQTHRRQLVVQ